jgi:hypothetical protein
MLRDLINSIRAAVREFKHLRALRIQRERMQAHLPF